MTPQNMERFAKQHPVGFLCKPHDILSLPALTFERDEFVAPKTIYNMDYNTRVEDQGEKPWCAAYAAAMFAENVLWRKYGKPPVVKEDWIYEYAKKHDGMPDMDGTTLVAAMSALLDGGLFNPSVCKVKVLNTPEQVKFAIHKFGVCIIGMQVTQEWYYCNREKPSIYGQHEQIPLGGHAVTCCGYDRSGFMILNSWGPKWGSDGFALVSHDCFKRQFVYGAVLTNCLNDIEM